MCCAADGWHAVLHIGSVEHRVYSKQPLAAGIHYAAELALDRDFEARAHAATRLWRAMNGRAPGPAFYRLSKQRRERLCAALRAVAAYLGGATYRSIAEALFGKKRIPDIASRKRTICVTEPSVSYKAASRLCRGYRKLLRPERGDG